MNKIYPKELKKDLCVRVCDNHESTIVVAQEYGVPLKTVEKWITAYYKDSHVFDTKEVEDKIITPVKKVSVDNYDNLSKEELKIILMRKDIELERLKKGYAVRGGGQNKEFATISKKNMK